MELRVKNVWFDDLHIYVLLNDSNEIKVAIELFPRLKNATKTQRSHFELWNDGKWIHWEEIDEDLSAEGFLKNSQQQTLTR